MYMHNYIYRIANSILCIFVSSSSGKQLRYTWPSTYDVKMPGELASNLPNLSDGLNGKHVTQSPWNRSTVLKTKGGQHFQSFAKFTKFYAGECSLK